MFPLRHWNQESIAGNFAAFNDTSFQGKHQCTLLLQAILLKRSDHVYPK